jgi:hypothetical protein
MILAVFRRRLRPERTFEEFIVAWEAEKGFGVPARVLNAVSLTDPREILSIGFVELEPEQLEAGLSGAAEQEQERHERIAEVIESTELRAFYDLRTEHDFSDAPREIDLGSAASLLAAMNG